MRAQAIRIRGVRGGHPLMHELAAPVGFWYFSPRRKVHVGVAFTLQEQLPVGDVSYYLVLTIFPLCATEGFASAEATKGLCDRPLETFAPHPYIRLG